MRSKKADLLIFVGIIVCLVSLPCIFSWPIKVSQTGQLVACIICGAEAMLGLLVLLTTGWQKTHHNP